MLIAELEKMGQEDWTSYRNKIAKFDEYLDGWLQNLLETKDQLPIVTWLKLQIDSYKVPPIANRFYL